MAAPRWTNATTVVALFTLMSAQALVVAGTLSIPMLAQSFGKPPGAYNGWIGVYGSALFFVAAVSAQASGSLVRRFGGFRMSQCTLLLTALGLLVIWMDQTVGLSVAAILFGCAYSQSNTTSGSLLSELDLGRSRNLVFSIKQTAVPLGGILAASYLPFASRANGAEMALFDLAIVCVSVWAVSEVAGRYVGIDRPPKAQLRNVKQGTPSAYGLGALVFIFFLFAAVQLGMSVTFVGTISPWLGISNEAATTIFGVAMLASIVLRLGLGIAADHWGASKVIQLMKLGIALTLFSLLWLDGFAVCFASMVCIAFAFAWNGVLLAEVARTTNSPERATARAMTAFFLAGASSPLVIVWSTNHESGVGWVIAVLAFVFSVALITRSPAEFLTKSK